MSSVPPSHVRFLNVLNAIRQLSPAGSLTADEQVMLDLLILQWHEGGRIALSDLMQNNSAGSQSTIYRRLLSLNEKGFVRFGTSPRDKRIRFVEPTDLARHHMQAMDDRLTGLLSPYPTN
jgi:Fe2+ or Zn2+ uptake regulation protein